MALQQSDNEITPLKKRPRIEQHNGDQDLFEEEDYEMDDGDSSLLSQPVSEGVWKTWTKEQVAKELENAGIDENVAFKFIEHNITGSVLDRITSSHLKTDMGISEIGTRQQVMKFLEAVGCFDTVGLKHIGTKVFNDPIHGHMAFHPLCVAIIDTPQFQRLRYLKQLGACYFVFPGAAHNRFEHCLGVCHLAGKLVSALQVRQPRLHITDVDVLCVQIAGLCHDLGHGPFSHVFDSKVIPALRQDKRDEKNRWEHEDASQAMFDFMVDENDLVPVFEHYGLTETDRIFIKEQIKGFKDQNKGNSPSKQGDWQYKGRTQDKAFLYEIVANKRNGIDVDKWDYFLRDCHHLGMRSSFDHTRFIHFARVIRVGEQMQICVRDKEAFDMYEMFHTRHTLHRRAYQHKVVQSIELILIEAMVLADPHIRIPGKDGKTYRISECIDHMDAYTNLTDNVFHQILLSESQEHDMQQAKKLLHKIQCRKLYKCVGESVPTKDKTSKTEDKICEDILKALSEEQKKGAELTKDRVRVQLVSLDFGMKHKNPVAELCFYSKGNENHAKPIKASEVSHLVPQDQFREQLVRVYLVPSDDNSPESLQEDQELLIKLRSAFRVWCKSNDMKPPRMIANILRTGTKGSPQMSREGTPARDNNGEPHVSGSLAKRKLPV